MHLKLTWAFRKIPYLLLTNGGGISEQDRCNRLTKQLGVPVSLDQYVQAHTILRDLSSKYANQPVLVLGGKLNSVREVAESYGFRKVYNTLDVLAWNPAVWPFYQISQAEREVAKPVDFLRTPIAAIFVFHDPRNWALDVQVICDVILSGGIIGGPFVHPNERPELELVFCNPDLLWRSDFSRPRLGQGAFKEAFQAVYLALTGSRYPYVQFGKPTIATYKFAEKMMLQYLEQAYGPTQKLPNMYMVGDNPESDIAGANAAGWSSVLVRTGVYDPQQGLPSHKPTHEADDVENAVKWVLERELSGITGVNPVQ